jgi:hypothetical protein
LEQIREDRIELAFRARIQDMEFKADGVSGCLHLLRRRLSKTGISWID